MHGGRPSTEIVRGFSHPSRIPGSCCEERERCTRVQEQRLPLADPARDDPVCDPGLTPRLTVAPDPEMPMHKSHLSPTSTAEADPDAKKPFN